MKNHEDEDKTLAGKMKDIQESYNPTEENKKKLIRESFKKDENEILNQDEVKGGSIKNVFG